MNKIFVNITSWTRIGSAGAEHFYAKLSIFEDPRNIYSLAREGWITTPGEDIQLQKPLTSENAKYLNKKGGFGSTYKKGDLDDRFDSIDEIKARVKELYPNTDIAFFNDRELLSEEFDVYIANPQSDHKKTGRKIRIHNFEGFSKEFVNLTEGSVHEVIETPERYKDKEDLQPGAWVWGVTEPVLVLRREFEYVNE
jgi:hypothetical protein